MKTRILIAVLCFVSLAGAQTRDPMPVPDLPGLKTLKCDFHAHTVFSDGQVWPSVRIQEAWRDGFDALSITDHADYHPYKDDVSADVARPYALARSAAADLGLILIPGVELGEGDTHLNLLFVTDPNAFKGLKLVEAAKVARAQSAFVFWNHPGWKSKPEWIPLIATIHEEKMLHGMELLNGDTFYPEAYPWIEEKGLAIFANSDVHGLQPAGRRRPVTLVFAKTASTEGVREALLARRTAAWMNGQVWGAEEQLRGLWQGAIEVESALLRRTAGRGGPGLRLHNRSAIPLQIKVEGAPAWLRVSGGELRPESASVFAVSIAKNAPAGRQQANLQLRVSNFHTGPERDLTVPLPLALEVAAP